uniref:Serine protease inhibitor CEI n=1 Tax=Trichuris suis TaxID=68888 RepID=Q9U6V1_9BILA|nr:serine protease inhibitor CEI [Trichuris suis]
MLTDGTLLIHLLAKAETQCGPNEQYTSCGSACPLTCEDIKCPLFIVTTYIGNKVSACTMQCVPGCFCKAHLPPWGPSRTFSLLILFNS